MRVFKFYSEEYHYTVSGETEEQAKECLFDTVYHLDIERTEEVSESEWDKKYISCYPGDDDSKKPFFLSIREIIDDTPTLICSNDIGLF